MELKQNAKQNQQFLKLKKNPSIQLKEKIFQEKSQKNTDKLNSLFEKFDTNKNNYLSLEQTLQGCKNILNLEQFYFDQQIIKRAFKKSRSLAIGQSRWESKFINKGFQFKHFFQFLVKITEFWFAFQIIGGSSKKSVQKISFESSLEIMKKWTVKQDHEKLKLQFVSVDKAFQYLDRNQNGSISLDQFIQFGFQYGLEIQASK